MLPGVGKLKPAIKDVFGELGLVDASSIHVTVCDLFNPWTYICGSDLALKG